LFVFFFSNWISVLIGFCHTRQIPLNIVPVFVGLIGSMR
jgi:hypothetical protein